MRKLSLFNKSSLLGILILSFTTLVLVIVAISNTPKKSNLDARKLTLFANPTVDSFLNGEWMFNTEEFFNDRIPFRELMISTYIQTSKHVFQQAELSGIWIDPESQMLFDKTPTLLGLDALENNLEILKKSTDAQNVPLLLAYVPRKQEVFASKLPVHWKNSYLEAKPKTIESFMATGETIDLSSAVNSRSDWYLTDHHWSSYGAKNASIALQDKLMQMGLPTSKVEKELDATLEFPNFIGSIGRRITAVGIPKQDKFEIPWTSSDLIFRCAQAHTRTEFCKESVVVESIGIGEDKYTNRYATFLGGDNSIDDIRGPGKGTYIVLKDSFGNSLVPYLALGSERIVAIDERHYRDGTLTDLIKKVKPDAVIFLHNQLSLSGFTSEEYSVWK